MNTVAHALSVWMIRQGLATSDPYLADRPPVVHSYWPADRRAQRTRDIARRLASDPSERFERVVRVKRTELSRAAKASNASERAFLHRSFKSLLSNENDNL